MDNDEPDNYSKSRMLLNGVPEDLRLRVFSTAGLANPSNYSKFDVVLAECREEAATLQGYQNTLGANTENKVKEVINSFKSLRMLDMPMTI